jgi:2-amino-4-hydroxy-6-hydroxymethyldihydropteridine diphosphokinase
MNSVVLSLGSNVGDRAANLTGAISQLLELPGTLAKKSSVYETAPWGNTDQRSFFNQVVEIETMLEADDLMKAILEIEKRMGRTRNKKWEPRVIDIDILFFNDVRLNSKGLVIPHPRLHERRFVLEPMCEILPGRIHPVFNKTVSSLLEELHDKGEVSLMKTIPGQ